MNSKPYIVTPAVIFGSLACLGIYGLAAFLAAISRETLGVGTFVVLGLGVLLMLFSSVCFAAVDRKGQRIWDTQGICFFASAMILTLMVRFL